jgi:hypothetical protein
LAFFFAAVVDGFARGSTARAGSGLPETTADNRFRRSAMTHAEIPATIPTPTTIPIPTATIGNIH